MIPNSMRARYAKQKYEPIRLFKSSGKSLKTKVLSRVFSEDFEKFAKKKSIIDPRGRAIRAWSKTFLAACLLCLFVDPLFFLLPMVQPTDQFCVETDHGGLMGTIIAVLRSATDLFFLVNVFVRFRTAYVAPSSRRFGRGELVIDPRMIASRYIRSGFWYDLTAALPIPQVLTWGIIPHLRGSTTSNSKTSLRFIQMIQYVQRLSIAYPLSIQIAKTTGIVTAKAWLGAAYNLLLYLLSGHVMGSVGYLLSLQRQASCWRSVCDDPAAGSNSTCNYGFFDCSMMADPSRNVWIQSSNISTLCSLTGNYPLGIYGPGLQSGITTSGFFQRYFYSLWFGLRSVSTQGQNFLTSIHINENIFSIVIVVLGLFNLTLLIGNMQRYIQSTTVRLEEWRLQKSAKEQWMHHRQLPHNLRDVVRRYDRYKWVATQGVNEEALLTDLPKYLRRQIKRHLCLKLVRRVELFVEMDERMLDSICVRLKPTLWTEGMFIVREGDPLDEMLFIIRGHLDSNTTNGGQIGFFNSCKIGPGDFCGEELLTWALKPHPGGTLPSSTRTVKAISDVEAFALSGEDLKFVASQFHRLHSKQLRNKLRFHSHQWRMWAACLIQAAWRRYKKRKQLAELNDREEGGSGVGPSRRPDQLDHMDSVVPQPGSGLADYAAMLVTRIRSKRYASAVAEADAGVFSPPPKPADPDFFGDET